MMNGQKNIKIGYLRLLLLMVSLFIFAPFLLNQTILGSDTKQRVYDFAGLLSKEEAENLETLSAKYSKKRKTDMIILTSAESQGKDIVEYTEDFYDENGLGYDKPHGNTVILTMDMENRDLYIAGFYRGEEYLDNSRCDLVRGKITPDLSRGDYYQGFTSFIKISSKYMGFRPGTNPNSIIFNLWVQIAISLTAAGIIVSIMAYRSSGKITVSEGTYRDPSNSTIIQRRDDYIRTSTTKRRKPSSNNSSSGGSSKGGGGGISRGGHSHSGSRGKF